MKQTLKRFDSKITKWVAATFGQRTRPFFAFMTMLGDPITVGIITAALIALGLYDSNMPLILSAGIIPLTILVGALLKILFERARPVTEYALNMKLQTFSFPSGHSSGSTITYGLLSYLAIVSLMSPWNVLVGGVLAVVPVAVGMSRVYLGAHFPSDVIAGWLLGALSVALIVFVVRPLI